VFELEVLTAGEGAMVSGILRRGPSAAAIAAIFAMFWFGKR
jgi:hypothetical protein